MYTFMESVHFYVCFTFLIIACFIPSQALMLEFEHFSGLQGSVVFSIYTNCHFHVSVNQILKLHYLENSTSIFGKCISGQFHSIIISFHNRTYLYPNGYGVVVLVGLMLLLLFVTYVSLWPVTECHIRVVTWALIVCLMYTPEARGPQARRMRVYIWYQVNHSCLHYNYVCNVIHMN